MSAENKLSQSLEDIISTSRADKRKRGGARTSNARPQGPKAPVGGVQKANKQNKPTKAVGKSVAAAPSGGETKIMISNLPRDVDENQLKDYFSSALNVGKPKRILMQFGADGRSLGSAMVIFHKYDQAVKATSALDNVKIDNRPIRVELLVSAANVAAPEAKPALADRVSQQKKDKPKPATAAKGPAATRGRGGRGGRAGRGGRGGSTSTRGKKKTVEELDAEMADYFPTNEGADNTAAAAPAGDAEMDEAL